MSQIGLCKITGVNKGKINGYQCPRCQQNYGFVHFGEGYWFYFCAEDFCMKDDSDSSKGKRSSAPETPKCASGMFGVGMRYFNAHVSKLRLSNAIKETISRWTAKPKNFLVINGLPGTGKTYLCVALANFFLEKGTQVKYLNGRRFFEEVQSAIAAGKSQYEQIRKIASYELLILDDIGAATNSEWQREVVLDLIDYRYNEQKPTVITSNMNKVDLAVALGDRTARRIFSADNIVITTSEIIDG